MVSLLMSMTRTSKDIPRLSPEFLGTRDRMRNMELERVELVASFPIQVERKKWERIPDKQVGLHQVT